VREVESVLSVFAPEPGLRRDSLYLGSAKAILMMQKNVTPPHCDIRTRIKDRFPSDLAQRNVHIAKHPTLWARPANGARRVLVNNFSAAGGNSVLLLEDTPREAAAAAAAAAGPAIDERGVVDRWPTSHPVAVSAKSASSLAGNVASLLSFLNRSDAASTDKEFLAAFVVHHHGKTA